MSWILNVCGNASALSESIILMHSEKSCILWMIECICYCSLNPWKWFANLYLTSASHFWAVSFLFLEETSLAWFFPMRPFWILSLITLKSSLAGWCGFLLFALCCLQSRSKESGHFFNFSQVQPDTNLCAALTSINFSWQPSQASPGCVSSRHALWWCPFSPFDFEEK